MSVNIFQDGKLVKVAGQITDTIPLINNFLTNQSGVGAADANTVYTLKNEIDKTVSDLQTKSLSSATSLDVALGEFINYYKNDKFNVRGIVGCNDGTFYVNSYVDTNGNAMGLAVLYVHGSAESMEVYSFSISGGGNALLNRLDNKIDKTDLISASLTTISTKVDFANTDAYFGYSVKNGMCTISVWSMKILEACSVETIVLGLPKPIGGRPVAQPLFSESMGVVAMVWIGAGGGLNCNATEASVGKSGYCTIVYPVEE